MSAISISAIQTTQWLDGAKVQSAAKIRKISTRNGVDPLVCGGCFFLKGHSGLKGGCGIPWE
ncbi:hypothetical protein [Paenibacillus sp. LPE1-1-1.1]|uniref:hypothetical protein n=1 Tax=Paenibacillus sp. LPE1-1-1.1 TaxID=3135230 RepID=UPI003428879B